MPPLPPPLPTPLPLRAVVAAPRLRCLARAVAERIVSLALPDKKYENNQSSLYKVRCLSAVDLVRHAVQPS